MIPDAGPLSRQCAAAMTADLRAAAFASLAARHSGAPIIAPDTLFHTRIAQLDTLGTRHRIPAM
jgi:hypothetical protein